MFFWLDCNQDGPPPYRKREAEKSWEGERIGSVDRSGDFEQIDRQFATTTLVFLRKKISLNIYL